MPIALDDEHVPTITELQVMETRGTGFIGRLEIFGRYGSYRADTNPKLQFLREELKLDGN